MKLTRENTAIVLDSTADFPEAEERFPNWRVVPLYVRFGEESYRDYVELGPDEFYARLADALEPPRTAAPSPGDFASVYRELAGYERVLSLHLPASLSGTINAAGTAAADFPAVRVIDAGAVSAAVAMLGFAIDRRLERGTTDEDVDELVTRFAESNGLLFTVETLEYLARGGRIGRASALVGQMLAVKPILTVRDGEVVPLKKVRGTQKAWDEFRSILEGNSVDEPSLRLGLAHAAAPERLATLGAIIRDARPHATLEITTSLGAVVGTHAGPGAIGLFWFDDPIG